MMRSMAGRWSDEHIAASLNRMGLPTGQGKTWTAKRVASVRRVREIHACLPLRREGRRLAHHDQGGESAWRDEPCHPVPDQRMRLAG